MKFKEIIALVKSIFIQSKEFVMHPGTGWSTLSKQPIDIKNLRRLFILPLLCIIAFTKLCGFLINFNYYGMTILHILAETIIAFIFPVLFLYLSVYLIKFIISTFVLRNSENPVLGNFTIERIMFFLVYGLIPYFWAEAFSAIMPELLLFKFFGFYSFYLMWLGFPFFFQFSENVKMKVAVVSGVVILLSYLLLSLLFSQLMLLLFVHAPIINMLMGE